MDNHTSALFAVRFFSKHLSHVSARNLAKYATQSAVAVATLLFCLKLTAYISTGADTLKMSCLDSAFDILISLTNLIVMQVIITKRNNKYMFGYDKAAALASFGQVGIIITVLLYTLINTLSFEVPNTNIYSMCILVFSFILSFCLIQFQTYVVYRTNSIIIEADRMHYQIDLFTNSIGLLCLIISWIYKIWWIDTVLAILVGLYIMKNLFSLASDALRIIMDKKMPEHEISHIKTLLDSLQYQYKNLNITFSGVKEVIYVDIIFNKNDTLENIEKQISKLKTHIKSENRLLEMSLFVNPISQ